ncbi:MULTISPECIES: M23 family metallopeptidase [unclassified Sphingomonas]|uniref:M23 family metallopeptidase n=1 Tax=unclassified Sphingomonas TaxID=196159 RepID=UPI0009E83352|nr:MULTISPECIES: M23 family metallopeptidase [unclassified Sphingomonas]
MRLRTVGACVIAAVVVASPLLARNDDRAVSLMAVVQLDRPFVQGGIARGRVPRGWSGLMLDDRAVGVAGDGSFLVAIDRDAGPMATLALTDAAGVLHRQRIAVAPRDWPIQRLDRVARFPQPSAEFTARRPAELARIAAARDRMSESAGWRQAFVWPANGRISGRFGSQRIYRGEPGAYHSGVDVARPAGTPVVAPADGVVTLAADSPFTLEGWLLIVDHGMGLNSAFLHLSRIDVREGDQVRQGQPIGAIGASGRASGPHLHWGVTWHGARIDPVVLLGPPAREDAGNAQEISRIDAQRTGTSGTARAAED